MKKNPSEKEMLDDIVKQLEEISGKKVKTIQVQDDDPKENKLFALVYFTDGSKLQSIITITTHNNKMAVRVQGNYI